MDSILAQLKSIIRLFASLAADSSSVVPYSRDIADQRRKYGESMLRRGDEHLATQKEFEAEAQAKLVAARLRRQMEKEKLEAIEVRAFFFLLMFCL